MTLDELNNLTGVEAVRALQTCCGATRWAEGMAAKRPFASKAEVFAQADTIWAAMGRDDILQAFRHHPKIGDIESLRKKFASTAAWASGEQAGVSSADEATIQGLAKGNADYEARYGFIFIVCATGKSAAEMLAILRSRLANTPEDELRIAAGEQQKITRIRLEKLLP